MHRKDQHSTSSNTLSHKTDVFWQLLKEQTGFLVKHNAKTPIEALQPQHQTKVANPKLAVILKALDSTDESRLSFPYATK